MIDEVTFSFIIQSHIYIQIIIRLNKTIFFLLTFVLNIFVQVYHKLVEKTKSTPGAQVENNKFCVSVHFRRVDENVR